MSQCKCGLSSEYPECNGTHKVTRHEQFREALLKTMEENQELLERLGND
jgi:CDGSH-type Zn-finger protein